MGKYELDNYEYDEHLKSQKKEKELRERHVARRNANRGYEGYHFGLGDTPVRTRDKDEFKKELEKRGLMMKDDVKKPLR